MCFPTKFLNWRFRQARDPRGRGGGGGVMARNAAVDDVPTRQLLQLRKVGFDGICAVTEGQRITKREYRAAYGIFACFLLSFFPPHAVVSSKTPV